jgi:hypothetical protein
MYARRAMMATNDQYTGASKFFAAVPDGTGAPGTAGVQPSDTAGTVIATPRILSSPYSSSQVEGNFSTVAVTSGDTSSSSADAPVPVTGDPLTGLSLADITSTGAGLGVDITDGHHPNSMARRP